MINLIPNQEKKEMVKGFYFRLGTLFIIVLAVSILFLTISIVPSYFLSSVKNKSSNTKLEDQKNEAVPILDQKTLAVIKDLNNKLDLLEKAKTDQFLVSKKVIKEIISEKMPNIKITDISYENNVIQTDPKTDPKSDQKMVKKISIQGIAPSREALLSFRLALESNSLFKQVDLPISNFIKGSNIQFYLSLLPS